MTVIQDAVEEMGGAVIESWLAIVLTFFAVASTVFAVLVTLRARSEEQGGRTEPVLATAVSRPAWLGSHVVIALAGSALLQLLAGLGLGISASQVLGDPELLGRVIGAALVHVPAIWVVTGIAAALYGLSSRAGQLTWLVIVYAGIVGWLGVLLQFPQWAVNLSPLGHTPLLPADPMAWTPVVVLLVAAAGLVALGLVTFRRRDIKAPT